MEVALSFVSIHLHQTGDSLKCRRYFCHILYIVDSSSRQLGLLVVSSSYTASKLKILKLDHKKDRTPAEINMINRFQENLLLNEQLYFKNQIEYMHFIYNTIDLVSLLNSILIFKGYLMAIPSF